MTPEEVKETLKEIEKVIYEQTTNIKNEIELKEKIDEICKEFELAQKISDYRLGHYKNPCIELRVQVVPSLGIVTGDEWKYGDIEVWYTPFKIKIPEPEKVETETEKRIREWTYEFSCEETHYVKCSWCSKRAEDQEELMLATTLMIGGWKLIRGEPTCKECVPDVESGVITQPKEKRPGRIRIR